jgi:hypothetical protein
MMLVDEHAHTRFDSAIRALYLAAEISGTN